MFDAGKSDHALEDRKALGIVFKQQSSIAEVELMHVVFWNGRGNTVQIRLRGQNCSDNEPNRVSQEVWELGKRFLRLTPT